ncbi:MAG: hypothetical protein RIQ70_1187 [Bacteroidota bacterium]
MKKSVLSIAILALTAGAFAQKSPKIATFQDLIKTPPTANQQIPSEKDLGVTLWSNDFSDATSWVLDNSGQSGPDYGWNINNTSEGWWAAASGILSTSGGNYAELVNGDPTASTQALNVIYTMTTAQPIDIVALGGTNEVSLQFQQYGARFNDLQEIQISTDGVNFIPVGSNADQPVLSQSGGAPYSNPTNKTINLATYLTATTSPIWVRFQWTTALPGSAASPNVWITYGWYIDDVKIVTNPGNDLSTTGSYWGTAGLNYYQIPTTQVAPIDFEASIFNGGVNTQNNVTLNVNVNSGAFTGSSTPTSILSLDTATVSISTPFTPAATVTNYTVTRSITADSTDDVPANNALSNISFAVTNYIYARDNNTVAGNTTNGTDGFESGNLFDIVTDQTLTAINVRLAGGTSGTTIGTEIYTKLYSIDPTTGEFVYEGESNSLIVASNNLNNNLVMPMQNPIQLTAGMTYLAVIGAYSGGLKVANAGTSEVQTSFFYDTPTDTWFYQTSTPYVRLNFDPTVGISEENNEFNSVAIFPNPTSTDVTISFDLATSSNATITLSDLSGKVISVSNMNNLATGTNSANIQTTNLVAGIYYVTLEANGSIVTKKVIKN